MAAGPRETVIRKTEDDGFAGTGLGALLDDAGVEALALCGVLSEMCVSATARTALARDFRVGVPSAIPADCFPPSPTYSARPDR